MAHLLSAPCDYVVRLLRRATAGTRTKRRSLCADECGQDHAHLLLRHQAHHARRHHLGHRGEARRRKWTATASMGWHLQKSQYHDHEGGGGCFVQGFQTHFHRILVQAIQGTHRHRRTPISQHHRGDRYGRNVH